MDYLLKPSYLQLLHIRRFRYRLCLFQCLFPPCFTYTTMTDLQNPDTVRSSPNPDGEQSFFRAWSIRQPHQSGSSESSSATTPGSPGTTPTHRRISRPFLSRGQSEHALSPLKHFDTINQSSSFRPTSLSTSKERLGPFKNSTSSYSALSQQSPCSSVSSVCSGSHHPVGPYRHPGKPASALSATKQERPGRTGYRWKREFSGHRLEITISRKSRARSATQESPCASRPTLARTHASDSVPQTATVEKNNIQDVPVVVVSAASPSAPSTTELTSGHNLLARAKRLLGRKYGIQSTKSQGLEETRTSNPTRSLPERGTTSMQQSAGKNSQAQRSDNRNNVAVSAMPTRSYQGRDFGFFKRSRNSISSSIRSLLGGKRPNFDEDQALFSTIPSKHQSPLTGPKRPDFIPSEARRVNTPPLSPQSSTKGRLRGFFFELRAPGVEETDNWMGHALEKKKRASVGAALASEKEWFRVSVCGPEQAVAINEFEFHIPEHLPTSPLCPRNPKHSSGGRGICVYHGRKRSLDEADE